MLCKKGREGILIELLDTEGNSFALGIHGQHDGFDFVTLFEIVDCLFARLIPGDVGQVHQSIDAAVEPDENTEIGDGLDAANYLITLLVGGGELFPGVGLALLDAQGNPAPLLVDVENHHFDLVTELNNLGGMDILVGPVHLRNVHQALDALFDLGEASVVGDIRDLS